MKVKLQANILKETLKTVKGCVSKNLQDVSSHLIFSNCGDGGFYVHAMNELSSAHRKTACESVEGEGTFTAPSKNFSSWLNLVDASDTLILEKEGGVLTATSSKGSVEFPSQTCDEIDSLRVTNTTEAKVFDYKDFLKAFESAQGFVSKETEQNKDLCQVFYKDGYFCAADTGAGVAIKLKNPVLDFSFGVHLLQIPSLVSFLESLKGHEQISILARQKEVIVFVDKSFYRCVMIHDQARATRLIDEEVSESKSSIVFNKKNLQYGIKFLSVVSSDPDILEISPESETSVLLSMESSVKSKLKYSLPVVQGFTTEKSFFLSASSFAKFFPLFEDVFQANIHYKNVQERFTAGFFSFVGKTEEEHEWKGVFLWKIVL